MPLLDHFHPPLSIQRYWHGFHNGWASEIAALLNERLPPRYFAQPNVHFGIEVDVGAFDAAPATTAAPLELAGAAPGAPGWQPAHPTQTLELAIVTDIVEVQVYQERAGPLLVAAIELVSPANKDRPAHRDAFVAKCMTSLRQGASLEQQLIVAKLRQVDETIKIACDLTETFAVMVRERQHEKFDAWMDQAETSGLPEFRTFVRGLRRDVSAVRNALSLSWSNRATEGQIHRLKLVKRSMYGRANFDLLKQRVLLAA